MANNSPHKGHRKRVRERILLQGFDSFQPHEILEFLLFHTVPQKDTNLMAHKLIDAFGSLQGVLDASAEDLIEKGNISENSAILLSSITDIFAYYEKTKKDTNPINTPEKMQKLFKPYFIGETREKLVAAYFDSALKVRKIEVVSIGQENSLTFNTKTIIRTAITSDAYCVAIAHNHPVTNAIPSKSDINATNDLKNQLKQFDIRLTDHIVFSSSETFSFANNEQLNCFVSGGSK